MAKPLAKLNKYHSQRESNILSIKLRYDSRIVPVSRYGNDTGISSIAYRKKAGIAKQLFL